MYRAATQSISHDEARSFLLFIQGPWRNAFAPSGANHLLLVVVSRAVLWLLPVSELTLRLPTVGGAVVYGLASAWLLRRFVADPWLRTAILALMTMNPYVLDFFSVARGYGIMLACLLAAICLLIPTADRELSKRRAIAGLSATAPEETALEPTALEPARPIDAPYGAERQDRNGRHARYGDNKGPPALGAQLAKVDRQADARKRQ